ncbi:hypothetical protein E2C01_067371 [Portunus trituberculatus]|uniref:Uncharacterized protein n=1 Tax=Portunus trituberculatus TaxID=210409 RepID=A0A5B7HSF7_PORTR|nr:hypothetical protein [Portunus trituberculatus]
MQQFRCDWLAPRLSLAPLGPDPRSWLLSIDTDNLQSNLLLTYQPSWRLVARLKVLIGCQELDPRNFNIRATSCREMASMNAWGDGNKVALRLLGTPPLQVVLLSYICIYVHKKEFLSAFYKLCPQEKTVL